MSGGDVVPVTSNAGHAASSRPTSAMSASDARLRFFPFATGRSVTVANNIGQIGSALTTSADGRRILYGRLDAAIDDLVLVENFR